MDVWILGHPADRDELPPRGRRAGPGRDGADAGGGPPGFLNGRPNSAGPAQLLELVGDLLERPDLTFEEADLVSPEAELLVGGGPRRSRGQDEGTAQKYDHDEN